MHNLLLSSSDKNKSLEKQTKQSYSEALSGRLSQDEMTEDYPGRSTVSERKEKRYWAIEESVLFTN